MKKIIILILLLMITASARAEEKIIIIGGYGSTTEELKFLEEKFPDSTVIIPQKYIPLEEAAISLNKQLGEREISGQIIFIAHSWGGLIVRKLAVNYPKIKIKKIIQIATPNNGYWISPWFVYHVDDLGKIPLFVIAGDKGAKKWYLRDGSNDGTVDLSSVLAIKAKESKIFHLDHEELIHNDLVVDQIRLWIGTNTNKEEI